MPIMAGFSVASARKPNIKSGHAALIEFKGLKFYITEQPSERQMGAYIQDLKVHNVGHLVRVGGTDYSAKKIEESGIKFVDLYYDDGLVPDNDIVSSWFNILKTYRLQRSNQCVAIHCRAGLGRSPLLVAMALVELGMKYEDAVLLIRQCRPGAINARQLEYLSKFRRRSRLSKRVAGCLPLRL